jgi:hypothetical protein
MAKVLFVVPVGQDMGGIITSTEQYVAGIRDAGHEVTPLCAVFTKRDDPTGSVPRGKFADDYVPGPGTGWLLHPTAGWRGEDRISIATPEGVARFIATAKKHDIVIWACMYSFRNDMTEGNTIWTKAIKGAAVHCQQVFMIHDDHLPERYPWAGALARYATAFVGVQPCSYDSLRGVAAPRAMVYTPMPTPPRRVAPMADRSGFLNCQIWKPWKNGDKLVAAAPLMPKGSVSFAGDGIQLRYMRSQDKCPPRYEGLWDAAMKKQKYLGVLSEEQRDEVLGGTKFLVDLSLRHNSGQLNRIAQEAMMQGCVVIANPAFITGTDPEPLIQPYRHYLPVAAENYGPEKLAAVLKSYEKLTTDKTYASIQKNARALAARWDRKMLGQQLVDIGMKKEPDDVRWEHPASLKVPKTADEAFVQVFGDRA